jgi:arylsulfatase
VERPSFLIVVTDQQRERAHWPAGVVLPAFDGLAARGLAFTRAYTPSPLCTPARAALFTGQHASALGMNDNVNFPWQPSLAPTVPTLATHLRRLGYRVGYVGKWHLTRSDALDADGLAAYGFDDWRGPDVHGRPGDGARHDPTFARAAAAWLRAHAGDRAPLCLVVSLVNPHDIMFAPRVRRPGKEAFAAPAPPSENDGFARRPTIHRRFGTVGALVGGGVARWPWPPWQVLRDDYVGYHLDVDRAVAEVLAAADAPGLRDRLVTVYTSDHGELAGAHGLRGKGPVIYDESGRVPLVWCGGDLPRGASTDALWSSLDLVPTLLGLAGAPPATLASLPGVDQRAALARPGARVRDRIGFVHRARSTLGNPWSRLPGWLIGSFDGRMKFARYHPRHVPAVGPGSDDARCEHELYDLAHDPFERTNLAHGAPPATWAAHLDATVALLTREGAWRVGDLAARVS